MSDLKKCSCCLIDKEKTCFNKKLNGLTAHCKDCLRIKRAADYKINPDKRKKSAMDYYEKNKQHVLNRLKESYKENPEKIISSVRMRKEKDPDGYRARCRELAKERHAANPAKSKSKQHNYRSRKHKNGGQLSKGIIEKLLTLQKNRCACCQIKLKTYHLDHVIAIVNGGSNSDDNVQLLCPTCNLKKGKKDPVEFMQSMGFLF